MSGIIYSSYTQFPHECEKYFGRLNVQIMMNKILKLALTKQQQQKVGENMPNKFQCKINFSPM